MQASVNSSVKFLFRFIKFLFFFCVGKLPQQVSLTNSDSTHDSTKQHEDPTRSHLLSISRVDPTKWENDETNRHNVSTA